MSLDVILQRLKKQTPAPKSEIVYRTPFELLVAVVLSAQSTDKSVNKITPALFALAPDPLSMSKISLEKLESLICSIGLYHNKAKNIKALSKMLVTEYNSTVPKTRQELMRLPGVGRKTANVVLNVAFGCPTLPVDTHILRVANRLGLCNTKDPLKAEKALLPLVPKEYALDAHHLLLLHGRYTCTARCPKCDICVIKDLCPQKIN